MMVGSGHTGGRRDEGAAEGPGVRARASAAGVEKAKRRYYVKWRVDGHDRTRSFKTHVEADRFRSGLLAAVQDGQRFDPGSGEPTSWLEHSGARPGGAGLRTG